MNSKELIDKCIKEQYKETVSAIFKIKNKQKLSEDDIIKEFDKLWISDNTTSSSSKKSKTPSTKKDIPLDERCHALKKDLERCKGRKSKNGDNPLLCSLHNRGPLLNGMIVESSDAEIDEIKSTNEDEDEDEIYNEEFE